MVPKYAGSLFRGLFSFVNSVGSISVSLFTHDSRGAISADPSPRETSQRDLSRGGSAGAGPAPGGWDGSAGRRAEAATRAAETQVGGGGTAPAGGRSRLPARSRHAGWRVGDRSPAPCRTLRISIVITGNLIKPGAINP